MGSGRSVVPSEDSGERGAVGWLSPALSARQRLLAEACCPDSCGDRLAEEGEVCESTFCCAVELTAAEGDSMALLL